ncbi:MAG: hypothetical protein GOV01_00090 [Candidatus Altiarchaeota archaeon]|nr:hypothetical protein [Candidatus Altiarchaeota archaeon]
MDEFVFSPASLDVSPDNSVVFKFPKFTITLLDSKGKLYAEVLEKNSRKTFKCEVKDNSDELDAAVNKVMDKLNKIIEVNRNK